MQHSHKMTKSFFYRLAKFYIFEIKSEEMKEIHQFSEKNFYLPKWKIKHLFIGTFNPLGGEKVNYYYGRDKNQTWNLLSDIFKEKFNPKNDDFFYLLEKHGIACMDLIHSIEFDENEKEYIVGKGYQDSKIINNRVKRVYNTSEILSIIEKNPGIQTYSTWGKGSIIKNWMFEVNKIPNLKSLVSPSFAAKVSKGVEKYPYMLDDWSSKINLK